MLNTRFVVVTGGVLSGLGKGIVTSSIALLLKNQGYKVSCIKIDPYINIDAGTMRPTEHGEVFVTDDGGETDQDMGNYERFLGEPVLKQQSITTGQVYLSVIQKERNLEYDGKCVEVIPHIPMEIERRITEVCETRDLDFCLLEVGGTVGDYQSVLFLEALREMKRRYKMVFVHVAYLPIPNNLGEMKTKPAQHSVRALQSSGIQPDFIIARSHREIDDVRKEKLSIFGNIDKEDVISAPDVKNIYEIPVIFEKQGFASRILKKFGLDYHENNTAWKLHIEKINSLDEEVKVGIVGKYFGIGDFCLEDSYLSVIESVKHASWSLGFKPKIQWINSADFEKPDADMSVLKQHDCIIVPGGFGSSGVEGKISTIRFCRENNIPFLGLCYGMQLAVIEFARNVCSMKDAHTSEIDKNTAHPVIDIMQEQKKLIKEKHFGGTMRLGSYGAHLVAGSLVRSLYGSDTVSERHRHRYEVNPKFVPELEDKGLVFSGYHPDTKLKEFIELPGHRYFVATQAHPEFKSSLLSPSPLFIGLIRGAKNG